MAVECCFLQNVAIPGKADLLYNWASVCGVCIYIYYITISTVNGGHNPTNIFLGGTTTSTGTTLYGSFVVWKTVFEPFNRLR